MVIGDRSTGNFAAKGCGMPWIGKCDRRVIVIVTNGKDAGSSPTRRSKLKVAIDP